MKRIVQELFVATVLFLACSAFQAKACTPNLHLVLDNQYGPSLDSVNLWDANENYLISGGTLAGDQVIDYDFTVTPGQVLYVSARDTDSGHVFNWYFTPSRQEVVLYIADHTYSESGDPISS